MKKRTLELELHLVTDLRIGHGLGPRAFRGPTQLLPLATHYSLKIHY